VPGSWPIPRGEGNCANFTRRLLCLFVNKREEGHYQHQIGQSKARGHLAAKTRKWLNVLGPPRWLDAHVGHTLTLREPRRQVIPSSRSLRSSPLGKTCRFCSVGKCRVFPWLHHHPNSPSPKTRMATTGETLPAPRHLKFVSQRQEKRQRPNSQRPWAGASGAYNDAKRNDMGLRQGHVPGPGRPARVPEAVDMRCN
jgi:hypothetical protein